MHVKRKQLVRALLLNMCVVFAFMAFYKGVCRLESADFIRHIWLILST